MPVPERTRTGGEANSDGRALASAVPQGGRRRAAGTLRGVQGSAGSRKWPRRRSPAARWIWRPCQVHDSAPHPPGDAQGRDARLKGGKNADYYEISMKQFSQQILPAGMPATTVWGYGAVRSASDRGLLLHNAPSLTIEAQAGRPVRVKWINDLKKANGRYRPHLLPVDPTLHWANPPGGRGATPGPRSPRRLGRRRPSSRTCTERSWWVTRATGTRRRGTSRRGQHPDGYARNRSRSPSAGPATPTGRSSTPTRGSLRRVRGPYMPHTDLSPIWNPEFFGNAIMVNGNTWPYQTCRSGATASASSTAASRQPDPRLHPDPRRRGWQIGNEGGFLAAPVDLTTTNGNRLLMGLPSAPT